MKTLLSLLAIVSLGLGSAAFAGSAKDYQVTGPVLEVTDSMIAVQKGSDRWELKRDSSTKGGTGVKVGDKVTVHYSMTATDIESKGAAKADAKASPAASPKK
jgi:hypothetical protein